jgi:cytochrome P450
VLYYLSVNLDWQTKLQEESDQFSETPSYEDAAKMTVSHAIIYETLRLVPVVPILFRQNLTKTTLAGVQLPERVLIL